MKPWHAEPSNPFDLRPDPPLPPSPRRFSVLMTMCILGIAGLCVVMCAGGGLFWLVRQDDMSARPILSESLSEKIAASTAAYASDQVGVSGNTLRQIKRLLSKVMIAARTNDDDAYRRLVDFPTLVARVKQSDHATRADFFTLLSLEFQVSAGTYVDPSWQRITLRHVVPMDAAGRFVAYTHCYDADGGETDVRFWIRQTERDWKITDWERLDLGLKNSDEWALYTAYAATSRLDDYTAAIEDINRVAELDIEQERAEAERLLVGAETRRIPPDLQDSVWVLLGYQWNFLGDSQRAIRCFDQVDFPDATPGVHFGRAIALADQDEYAAAVKAMWRYEETVGAAPEVCRIKAGWLSQLGREAEELAEWKKLLRAIPDDDEALQSLAQLMNDDEMESLAVYLARTNDPQRHTTTLAELFSDTRSGAGLDVVARIVSETFPKSAEAAYVAGLRSRDAGQSAQAAGEFRRAMELVEKDALKSASRYRYLDTMVEVNRVEDAYQNVDDRCDAFDYLLRDYDEGDAVLTSREVDALVAVHRTKHPHDALGAYLAGLRLAEEGQFERAAAEFRESFELAEPEHWLRNSSQYELRASLVKSGNWREAYRLSDPPAEGFAEIASHCRALQRWEDLRGLLDDYDEFADHDPWASFFRAALLIHDHQLAAAEKLLERLSSTESAAEMDSSLRYEVRAIQAHPRLWQAAYDRAAESNEASLLFQNLAYTFSEQCRFDDLRLLLAKHRVRFPDDLQAAMYYESLLVTDKDYTDYVETWFPYRDRLVEESAGDWRIENAVETLVRVLLRVGRVGDAFEVARRTMDELERSLPLILCQATAGQVEATCQTIEQYLDGRSMYLLYDDESIGPLLRSPSYAELRTAHPWEIPYSIGENDTVLLFEHEPRWHGEQLQAKLHDLGESVEVTLLPNIGEKAVPRFAINIDEARLLISVHNRKYSSDRTLPLQLKDESRRAALEQHAAFVSLSGSRWARPSGQTDCRMLVQDVALRLAPQNCLAIGLVDQHRLLQNNTSTRRAWAAAKTNIQQGQLGEYLPMYADWQEGDFRGQRALASALRQLRRAFATRQAGDEFTLGVSLKAGVSAERLWISLEEIRGGFRYVGRLIDDSLLAPEFAAGERLLVEEYELCACRFHHAGQTIEAIVEDDQ
jgi:hypothetical protein